MDRNIGRILDTIRAQGEIEDTLVMFLSDNGGCAEIVHITQDVPPGPVNSYRTVDPPWANVQNTPFRNYKRYNHEGGIASPFIAHWPAAIAAGRITREVGHLIDLLPTCLELAGVTNVDGVVPDANVAFEGQSLVPVFRGEKWTKPRSLFWQFQDCAAVRAGDWKLVRAGEASPWELYNLVQDRTEVNDLASSMPDKVDVLKRQWIAWAERVGANR
jgi:arylsulfatase